MELLEGVNQLSKNNVRTEFQKKSQNSNRFMEENNTFARASRFLYIYLPLLHDYDVKMPNFILLWRT